MPLEAFSLRRRDSTFLGQIGRSPFVDLASSLRAMGFYNSRADAMRELTKPLAGELLRKDGSNLPSIVRALVQFDPRSFARARECLANVAVAVRHFEAVPYGEYETVRFEVRSDGESAPTVFDAASMSDGTLRALCNIMAAFQYVPPHGHPSVVGIEEPETALHPAALRALVDALREATQHTQIVLTTHSPDLLADRYLDAARVLVARNRAGVTQIAPVDPASLEIVQKELCTLADLQRMDHLEPDPTDLARQAQTVSGNGEK
jgi:predicted ATPase